jgi:DNA modification methylase
MSDPTVTQPNMWTEPVQVQRGDLFMLGKHRLMCGDSTSVEDVARLMQGKVAQLGLHDPPYGLRAIFKDKRWRQADGKKYSGVQRNFFPPVSGDDQLFNPRHLLTSGKVVVIWGANHFADKLPSSSAWIVWDKRIDIPSNSFSDGEVAWVSTGNRLQIIRHRWHGMIKDSERGIKRVHPTQKPIFIFSEIITRYTQENDLVTDWYAGSGTTLIASESTNRIAYLMEIEPHYCSTTIQRWQEMTGQQAERTA